MNAMRWYLLAINIIAFLVYAIDKKKAVRKKYRIRESCLMGVAVIGGSVGAWMSMHLYRHKTQKPKFYIGVPLIFIVQAVGALIFHYYT